MTSLIVAITWDNITTGEACQAQDEHDVTSHLLVGAISHNEVPQAALD
jgi:hypothetical protein